LAELIECVGCVTYRHPLWQVAADDGARGVVDHSDQNAAAERQQQSRAGPAQAVDNQGAKLGAVLDVSPDEQVDSIRQSNAQKSGSV
jgi:hypothetical protein